MLSTVMAFAGTPCFSKVLHADLDYSVTIRADSQASKVYTPLAYPVAEELHKLRGKRTFLRLIKLLTLKLSVIVHKVFCRTLEVASLWKD